MNNKHRILTKIIVPCALLLLPLSAHSSAAVRVGGGTQGGAGPRVTTPAPVPRAAATPARMTGGGAPAQRRSSVLEHIHTTATGGIAINRDPGAGPGRIGEFVTEQELRQIENQLRQWLERLEDDIRYLEPGGGGGEVTRAELKLVESELLSAITAVEQRIIDFEGTPGPQGPAGAQGAAGERGERGEQGLLGLPGAPGERGEDGLSAYELAVLGGFIGDLNEWLASFQGIQGPQGEQGIQGEPGPQGAAGARGEDGLSAYEIAVLGGFVGTPVEWMVSLRGDQGEQGPAGERGERGESGELSLECPSDGDYALVRRASGAVECVLIM
ncbi:MAG: collagen-like protein [Alphaproteobacteria bacterium]|nr:collagen-like protein [Alphaproteobacteria bacterium]MCL2757799.1 collagen-like protein [Alphaproteobacteria bacterium]